MKREDAQISTVSSSIAAFEARISDKLAQMQRDIDYRFSQFESALVANGYILSNSAPIKHDEIDVIPEERARDVTLHTATFEYEEKPYHAAVNQRARDELVEEVSPFTFAGEVRPLNVLLKESSITLKEPSGIIYSEKSSESSSDDSNASYVEHPHIISQLTGESADGISMSLDENHIRQVDDQAHGVLLRMVVEKSRETKLSGIGQNEVKIEISSLSKSENSYGKMALKSAQQYSSSPCIIYFLIYTLRTRWFLKRGRMLWIKDGQQGWGLKSRRRAETRSKESKWPTWHE
ncbi:hypothetical protein CASFOL_035526 [Castilleja foliolosa]|uniref:Uncharacterized protein n=1 Tax=Castilleja foliolosa TaxID=1961234 RepID=A0ABD3BTU7_9LAMI